MYNVTIKLSDIPTLADITFPEITDLAIKSREFSSYVECIDSAKLIMIDITQNINKCILTGEYAVISEVNPVHSGVPTRSKDWGEFEIARLWIFNKQDETAEMIRAAGQARIFMITSDHAPLVN